MPDGHRAEEILARISVGAGHMKRFFLQLYPYFWAYPGSAPIVVISLMVLWQTAMVMVWPFALRATCLTAVLLAWQLCGIEDGLEYVLAIMIMSAAAAVVGAVFKLGRIRMILFLPQHLLLSIMAAGGAVATWRGEYLDGTVIPWPQISADQIGYVALLVIYSIAIRRRARVPDG